MTRSDRPPPPAVNPRLARDVAKHLDRRRMRRRLVGWSALLAAVAAAAMYLRCGVGFGLGGAGEGDGPGSPRTLTEPRRCAIRIAAGGITVDGKPMLRDRAVKVCKVAAGADVVITGDAREGDGAGLVRALQAAGVSNIVVHEPPAAGTGSASSTGSK
jgi:hypothetical protein